MRLGVIKKEFWFFLSSFCIMFTILSWLQDMGLVFQIRNALKGIIATIGAIFLYIFIARDISRDIPI